MFAFRSFAVALALLFGGSALADVTISNFNTSVAINNSVARFDASYSQIDAQDAGHIVQVGTCPGAGCVFYWVGTSKGCLQNPIYMLMNYGGWCGFVVRTSTDLKNWSAPSTLYGTPNADTECSPSFASGSPGCWSPGIIFNASTGKWVIWGHDAGASPPTVIVLVCDQDASGGPSTACTKQNNPTGPTTNSGVIGSTSLFLDDADGSGYLCYSSPNGGGSTIYIQKLNAAFTDVTGSVTTIGTGATGGDVEAPACFKKGSTYYAMFGNNCPYCAFTDSSYRTASSPLGTWSASTQINANSCFGQLGGVDKLTINGSDVYLYHVDQWWNPGSDNQALANQYFDQLTFTGSAIDTLTCKTSITIAGLTEVPNTAPTADQSNYSAEFQLYCDVSSTKQRLQTFVPAANYISNIYVTTAQNTTGNASECSFPATGCGQINGDLVIDFVTVDGSNNPAACPGAGCVSTTYTPSQIRASLMNLAVPVNQAVTPSSKYGLILRGTNTSFSYCFAYNDLNSYSAGVQRQSVNSGSTWSTETNRSLRFWTGLQSASVPFSGVAH